MKNTKYNDIQKTLSIFNLIIFLIFWMLCFLALLQKLNIYCYYKHVGASLSFCFVVTVISTIVVIFCYYIFKIVTK